MDFTHNNRSCRTFLKLALCCTYRVFFSILSESIAVEVIAYCFHHGMIAFDLDCPYWHDVMIYQGNLLYTRAFCLPPPKVRCAFVFYPSDLHRFTLNNALVDRFTHFWSHDNGTYLSKQVALIHICSTMSLPMFHEHANGLFSL